MMQCFGTVFLMRQKSAKSRLEFTCTIFWSRLMTSTVISNVMSCNVFGRYFTSPYYYIQRICIRLTPPININIHYPPSHPPINPPFIPARLELNLWLPHSSFSFVWLAYENKVDRNVVTCIQPCKLVIMMNFRLMFHVSNTGILAK